MEKGKLTITVSGKAMTGKSHLVLLLKKFLQENGFDVEHEIPLEEHKHQFERLMSENFDDIICRMKEQKEIIIKEMRHLCDCGNKHLKQWREGDGRGFVERYKCEDCGYVGENLKVGHYSG
jgi:predicted RNA-binding Zn-ribbon protein involved in translation (DUF1610 family)